MAAKEVGLGIVVIVGKKVASTLSESYQPQFPVGSGSVEFAGMGGPLGFIPLGDGDGRVCYGALGVAKSCC